MSSSSLSAGPGTVWGGGSSLLSGIEFGLSRTSEGSSEEEGGGVMSGPGTARTILLFHSISDRPSKQPRMVGSTLGVCSFGLIFVSAGGGGLFIFIVI